MVNYERSVYGVISLMGDIGGVMELLMAVAGVLLVPYNSLNFALKKAQVLFYAKSQGRKFFRRRK